MGTYVPSRDVNIITVVEDGLRGGQISIPGQVAKPNGFDGVESVTGYLNAFGVTVAQRIRNQFGRCSTRRPSRFLPRCWL
jgi:hypothetical protein